MNKKTCQGFSPLIIIVGIFVLLSLGTGIYFVKRNPSATPTPLVSMLPIPASTSTPIPTPIATRCVVGGCSGELCVAKNEEALASICVYRSEYTCYKKARCEIQQNGACGWTQTPELTACMKTAQTTPASTPYPVLCNPSVKCVAPSPLFAATPIPTPIMTPSQSPSATPLPTPIITPSQSSNVSPLPSPLTELRVEADDLGFYPAGAISFPAGTRVKLTFAVRTSNVYYGGLDFRSSKFSAAQASPGQTVTVEFTVDSSFVITSYWPVSDAYKASLQVNLQ